jgi:hypothetical protein
MISERCSPDLRLRRKDRYFRSKPARSQKLRSGLEASLAPIDGSVHYHSLLGLADGKAFGHLSGTPVFPGAPPDLLVGRAVC